MLIFNMACEIMWNPLPRQAPRHLCQDPPRYGAKVGRQPGGIQWNDLWLNLVGLLNRV